MKGWKKLFPFKWKPKKAGVAILTSDKIDFKTKTTLREKKELYNDKGVNLTRGYNICKYLCTQYRSTKYIKQILTGM